VAGIRRTRAPALLGPVVTTVAIITVGVLICPKEPLLGGPFMNWLFGVAVYGVLALGQGACMLAFEALFALFAGPVRSGRRCAWIAGLVAPLPVAVALMVAPPSQQGGLVWVALFAPIVVFAGLVVWVRRKLCARGGRRPG